MLLHNSEVGYMFSSLRSFMNRQMRAIFKDCPDALEKKIPTELLADHYSNTLFLVWQWATETAGRDRHRAICENSCSYNLRK